ISPGHLPNSLTVEKIRAGNSNIRNPVLVTYIAKGLLPYHGLGSGIKRALERWPHIDFKDDREGCLFTVTVHRDATRLAPVCDTINETISTSCETISAQDEPISETIEPRNETIPSPNETLDDVQSRLLALIHADPQISYAALVDGLGKGRATVARQIAQLKEAGLLRRVGSKKTGHWEVLGA
ncbi:MAG: winged helix-turn-helix transcriptional regulator, partial [Actinomycetaceae bacterium]|nr:winged helix-turn-helix transcriptional regulator [Actinomycetaceae bacterium]